MDLRRILRRPITAFAHGHGGDIAPLRRSGAASDRVGLRGPARVREAKKGA